MRILKLSAENIKRLKIVEISPNGNVIQLTGKNGQGKSSVLDCIWYGLGGTDDIPSHPVRRGAQKGIIQLDLGELIVTREFAIEGVPTRLRVQSKSTRATFATPQKMLDGLLGPLSLDPIGFMRMKPKDQAQQLKAIAKLDVDPDELDAKNKEDYDLRREENRIVKMYEVQLATMPAPPEDLPAEPIDLSQLDAELEKAGEHNATISVAEHNLANAQLAKQQGITQIDANNIEIASYHARIAALQAANAELAGQLHELDETIATFVVPTAIETSAIRERIENARAVNAQIEKKKLRDQVVEKLESAQKLSQGYTESIQAREDLKTKAIAEAKMPVEGLSFQDGEVFFDGLPLNQASGRDQLRISTAIAMSSNPQLRIIRITDGSGIDSDGMALLEQMAAASDFQIWIERVDETGEVGIVMEDGEVVAINEPAAVAAVEVVDELEAKIVEQDGIIRDLRIRNSATPASAVASHEPKHAAKRKEKTQPIVEPNAEPNAEPVDAAAKNPAQRVMDQVNKRMEEQKGK